MRLKKIHQNISWNLIISPRKTIKRVIKDKKNLPFILTITILAVAFYAIVDMESLSDIWLIVAMITSVILSVACLYGGSYILHTAAKLLFKGKGTFFEMLLGIGLTGVISLINVILYGIYFLITGHNAGTLLELTGNNGQLIFFGIQGAIGIWSLVITVITVSIVEKIQWWKSIIVILVSAIAILTLTITLVATFGFIATGLILFDTTLTTDSI